MINLKLLIELIKYLLIAILFGSCGNKTMYLSSKNNEQYVTIKIKGDYRYIIVGKHFFVPDSNYILINTAKVPALGDCLHICWDLESLGWKMVVHKSEIIENKLDTVKYKFSTILPLRDGIIPTEVEFRKYNCAIYDFYSNSIEGNGVIK